ncbi:PH domain-containing protein [Amycolatopsis arida]|uniref:PH domain-containing protein n=1 Tax=Amycolatopsis arida TaxID=587909 RepID=A0A1I5STC4_9PSEU|nr:PH domain-containing protein [Amycolatopsis arida]TDX96357.1 PH (Pleckstrin Homology) domain-containing protein [Amycolatopsis arida]SFP73993.1 PH domain-containing protein [Amycolatopsis arida]
MVILSLIVVSAGAPVFMVDLSTRSSGVVVVAWVMIACLAFSAVMIWRAWTLGIDVKDSGVVVHNWLRSHHLPWQEISRFMLFDGGMSVRRVQLVVHTTDKRIVKSSAYSLQAQQAMTRIHRTEFDSQVRRIITELNRSLKARRAEPTAP